MSRGVAGKFGEGFLRFYDERPLETLLLAEGGKTAAVDVALIYSSKEIVPYKTVENALRRILQQIAERL